MLLIQSIALAAILTKTSFALSLPDDIQKRGTIVSVPRNAPANAGIPLDGFVSYSIEFSSFPDFAGNKTSPNTFSNTLLENLGRFSGTKPHIRVGGNTQDLAVFNESQKEAAIATIIPELTPDYPSIFKFGPAYFESYQTWPGVKFVHGFNLAKNSSADRRALLDSVPYACKAIGGHTLSWELGNEPDLFKTTSRNTSRPPSWDEQDYAHEWVKYTRAIRQSMKKACPSLASGSRYKYYAPSFAGTNNSLDPIRAWESGLDADKDISVISQHNYISGAESPGVTLQGTLMNHSSTVASVAKLLNSSNLLAGLPHNLNPDLPFVLGETNSLYNQGRPGLSNTFGAALWGIDFNLWCATNSIRRVHMHIGTNYRYQAWQPVDTNLVSKGTKAPYYSSIAVAAFLGVIGKSAPSIVNLPLPHEQEAAYATYFKGKLQKLMVINMMAYNHTDYNVEFIDDYPRPVEKYSFQLPKDCDGKIAIQRLLANGSDAITGITFDGYSYNYELDEGRPVLLQNVTRGETVRADKKGVLRIDVPRSSAVILSF